VASLEFALNLFIGGTSKGWGMYCLVSNAPQEPRGSKLLKDVERTLERLLCYSETDAGDFIEAYALSLQGVEERHGELSAMPGSLRRKVAHDLAMAALSDMHHSNATVTGLTMAAAKLEAMSLTCENALMALGYLLTLEETMADYADA
jgi:hypothetical protein